MEAEYFPPKEDVVLQNEVPTDLYVLVSGAAVSQLNMDSQLTTKVSIFTIVTDS